MRRDVREPWTDVLELNGSASSSSKERETFSHTNLGVPSPASMDIAIPIEQAGAETAATRVSTHNCQMSHAAHNASRG